MHIGLVVCVFGSVGQELHPLHVSVARAHGRYATLLLLERYDAILLLFQLVHEPLLMHVVEVLTTSVVLFLVLLAQLCDFLLLLDILLDRILHFLHEQIFVLVSLLELNNLLSLVLFNCFFPFLNLAVLCSAGLHLLAGDSLFLGLLGLDVLVVVLF